MFIERVIFFTLLDLPTEVGHRLTHVRSFVRLSGAFLYNRSKDLSGLGMVVKDNNGHQLLAFPGKKKFGRKSSSIMKIMLQSVL